MYVIHALVSITRIFKIVARVQDEYGLGGGRAPLVTWTMSLRPRSFMYQLNQAAHRHLHRRNISSGLLKNNREVFMALVLG